MIVVENQTSQGCWKISGLRGDDSIGLQISDQFTSMTVEGKVDPYAPWCPLEFEDADGNALATVTPANGATGSDSILTAKVDLNCSNLTAIKINADGSDFSIHASPASACAEEIAC